MRFYTPATMADLNVTFAGLPLAGPVVVETTGSYVSTPIAGAAAASRAGAFMLSPLDERRMLYREDSAELANDNMDDSAHRHSERIIRRLNVRAYLEDVSEISRSIAIPVITPLQTDHGAKWLPLAHQLVEAGASAVELRPIVEPLARAQRTDQIEKAILRTTALVAGRIDAPVIVRIPCGGPGAVALSQSLGDCGASAITLRAPESIVAFNVSRVRIAPPSTDAATEEAAFMSVVGECRALYRRVSPHIAVTLPSSRPQSIVEALLAGASVGFVTADGADARAEQERVDQVNTALNGWMRQQRVRSLFDARGLLSESRVSSSLEKPRA
jgi:hypothetical protein